MIKHYLRAEPKILSFSLLFLVVLKNTSPLQHSLKKHFLVYISLTCHYLQLLSLGIVCLGCYHMAKSDYIALWWGTIRASSPRKLGEEASSGSRPGQLRGVANLPPAASAVPSSYTDAISSHSKADLHFPLLFLG